ncbi:mitochondrial 54S ribosomal protein mL46 [Limtongia smithiae]|uniref:mitochondrial 54S ribosomal protein mL46 n=1 Tax=Limtongia smithiae TaxID=1125753 RepID=UPI0034CF2C04
MVARQVSRALLPQCRSFAAQGLPSRETVRVAGLAHTPRRRLSAATAESAPAVEKKYKIFSGLILSRQPIVTPELTPFQKAYYNYQSELYKRLSWTFQHWFYYPKGTLAENDFAAVQPKLNEKDPDVLFNRNRNEKQVVNFPERQVERETEESAKVYAKIVPNPRRTAADEANDVQSLERKLDRTLYLLVKRGNTWELPRAEVLPSETLDSTASRMLAEYGGINMNTHLVSKTPALFYQVDSEDAKVFFLKSRIFHGAFVPQKKAGVQDFVWVTKDEILSYVSPEYYAGIADALGRQ